MARRFQSARQLMSNYSWANFFDLFDLIHSSKETTQVEKLSAFSVAASYSVNTERRISTIVIIAKDEQSAAHKMKNKIAMTYATMNITIHTLIVNQISERILDRIKLEC